MFPSPLPMRRHQSETDNVRPSTIATGAEVRPERQAPALARDEPPRNEHRPQPTAKAALPYAQKAPRPQPPKLRLPKPPPVRDAPNPPRLFTVDRVSGAAVRVLGLAENEAGRTCVVPRRPDNLVPPDGVA